MFAVGLALESSKTPSLDTKQIATAMVDVGGVFLAVLSAIFNGTFGTLSKIKHVQDAEVYVPNLAQGLQSITPQLCRQGGVHFRCVRWHASRGTMIVW